MGPGQKNIPEEEVGEAGSAALSHSNITLPPRKRRGVYWKKPEQSEENILLYSD